MPSLPVRPTVTLRVKVGPDNLIGPGKIELLEAIKDSGSLSAASKLTTISYRKSRNLLDALNTSFNAPVVQSTKGGNQHGGAALTPLGLMLIERYRAIEAACNATAEREMSELLASFGKVFPDDQK